MSQQRTPPRKLDIGGAVAGPPLSASAYHQTQGIAALFAITFDLRVPMPLQWKLANRLVQAGYTITWQRPDGILPSKALVLTGKK
jgi:hypothetical protein